MTHINDMTRKEFDELPLRDWTGDLGPFDSLVILPQRTLHDSGYRCMDFVAVKEDKAVCRLSGCSDVIHIQGIGGFGRNWFKKYGTLPKSVTPKAWNIDCLKKSGLLRIFCSGKQSHMRLIAGIALSSFELFAEDYY